MPSLLIDDYPGVTIQPIDGPTRKRDIYALLPPGDRHPLAEHVIAALTDTAHDFNTQTNAGHRGAR